ncbi:MAG TPA: hypothetical protein VIZ17_23225, partial [Acetobacteraceae bacterium]
MALGLQRDAVQLALPLDALHDAGELVVGFGAGQDDVVRAYAQQAVAAGGEHGVGAGGQAELAEADAGEAIGAVFQADRQQVGAAEELGGEAVGRIAIQRLRGAERHQAAVTHDGDAVGQGEGLGLVVGDVHDRQRGQLAVQAGQLVQHVAADLGVEGRQRLVEQQHLRLDGQGAGDGDALLLAAAELAGEAAGERAHADQGEAVLHALADGGFGDAASARAECDILVHAHVGEQGVVLHHHADAAGVGRQVGDVVAADADAAGGRADEAGHCPQRGGLAGAGGADDGHDLAGRDGEGKGVECHGAAIGHRDVLYFDAAAGGGRHERRGLGRPHRVDHRVWWHQLPVSWCQRETSCGRSCRTWAQSGDQISTPS